LVHIKRPVYRLKLLKEYNTIDSLLGYNPLAGLNPPNHISKTPPNELARRVRRWFDFLGLRDGGQWFWLS
jgi:hypothetical protein